MPPKRQTPLNKNPSVIQKVTNRNQQRVNVTVKLQENRTRGRARRAPRQVFRLPPEQGKLQVRSDLIFSPPPSLVDPRVRQAQVETMTTMRQKDPDAFLRSVTLPRIPVNPVKDDIRGLTTSAQMTPVSRMRDDASFLSALNTQLNSTKTNASPGTMATTFGTPIQAKNALSNMGITPITRSGSTRTRNRPNSDGSPISSRNSLLRSFNNAANITD